MRAAGTGPQACAEVRLLQQRWRPGLLKELSDLRPSKGPELRTKADAEIELRIAPEPRGRETPSDAVECVFACEPMLTQNYSTDGQNLSGIGALAAQVKDDWVRHGLPPRSTSGRKCFSKRARSSMLNISPTTSPFVGIR